MTTSTYRPELCPVANICERTIENGPACGSTFDHFPPLPLAENLCPRTLYRQLNLEEQNGQGGWPGKTFYRIGSAYIDIGLAQEPGSERAAEAFGKAESNLARSVEACDPETLKGQHYTVSAKTQQLYLPTMRARQEQRSLVNAELQDLHRGVGELMAEVASIDIDQPHWRTGWLVKLATQALFLRQGDFLYPGTARESHSFGKYSPLNHDGYIIHDGEKVPVKPVKFVDRRYEKNRHRGATLLILPYVRYLLRAESALPAHMRRPEEEGIFEESFNNLQIEASGRELTIPQKALLDRVSGRMRQDVRLYAHKLDNAPRSDA